MENKTAGAAGAAVVALAIGVVAVSGDEKAAPDAVETHDAGLTEMEEKVLSGARQLQGASTSPGGIATVPIIIPRGMKIKTLTFEDGFEEVNRVSFKIGEAEHARVLVRNAKNTSAQPKFSVTFEVDKRADGGVRPIDETPVPE